MMVRLGGRRGLGAWAFASMILAADVVGAPAFAEDATPAPVCDEDRALGEPPTISGRFDLTDNEGGLNFVKSRQRAIDWCARQTCTVEGRAVVRKAHIRALTSKYRQYFAGFSCPASSSGATQDAAALQTVSATDLTFSMDDPSGVNDAMRKALDRCKAAHAKAELVDFRKQDEKLVAKFACEG